MPVRTFSFRGPKPRSSSTRVGGAWAACARCAGLIDGRRWAELTDRAFTNFIKQNGVPRYAQFDVREQFREIHQLFREHLIKES
jgi:hypothetical protein